RQGPGRRPRRRGAAVRRRRHGRAPRRRGATPGRSRRGPAGRAHRQPQRADQGPGGPAQPARLPHEPGRGALPRPVHRPRRAADLAPDQQRLPQPADRRRPQQQDDLTMNARALANQYRQTGVTSAALDASPHQLIALMLAGARDRARLAAACLERGDLPRKAQASSDASAISGGLNGALNVEAGGEIADGLHALYDYAQRRLLTANAHNDPAPLHEVDDLLGEIESAWLAIGPEAA